MADSIVIENLVEHGRHCLPCSTKFSMTLQLEICSTEKDFLKQIIFLKSFNSVLLEEMKHIFKVYGYTAMFFCTIFL